MIADHRDLVSLGDRTDLGWKPRLVPGLGSQVGGLAFATDGRTLLTGGGGGADPRLQWWRETDDQFTAVGNSLPGPLAVVGLSLTANREGQLLVGFGSRLFWSNWNGSGLGEIKVALDVYNVQDASVALTQPRLALLKRADPRINLYNLDQPPEQSRVRFPTRDPDPTCLALSPNGRTLVTGCRSGPVRLWRQDGNDWKDREVFKQPLGRLTVHPDGKSLFAGCCDGLIRVWNVEAESITERYHLNGHHGEVTRMVLAPGGTNLASADVENRLIVWDLDSKKTLLNYVWPGAVTSLAFAPDSRHLAVGMSNGVTYLLRVHPTPK